MWLKKKLGDQYEPFINEQLEEKKIVDSYGMKYLGDIDLEICKYVINQLFDINVEKTNFGKEINQKTLIDMCLEEIEKLGTDIYLKVKKIIFSTPIITESSADIIDLSTGISYEYKNGKINEDSGIVTNFYVPEKIYEISAYFFGHEQLHALKDINFKEYINVRILGEVIPIFYEFMIYNPDSVMKRELIKIRMNSIIDNVREYTIFNVLDEKINLLDSSFQSAEITVEKQIYKYMISKIGCYLNSFYYALILYNIYKENPKKILKLVNRVLKCEITTMNMLEQLDIYGNIRGEIFEKELYNIRKLIK